ncbi:hypothetical protein ScPMuIL_017981 [Solemya velum]
MYPEPYTWSTRGFTPRRMHPTEVLSSIHRNLDYHTYFEIVILHGGQLTGTNHGVDILVLAQRCPRKHFDLAPRTITIRKSARCITIQSLVCMGMRLRKLQRA